MDVGSVDAAGHARRRTPGGGRSWSLKYSVAGFLVLLVVAGGVDVFSQRVAAADAARNAAIADATFAAGVAANQIADEIDIVRSTVAATANRRGVVSMFAMPTGCSLSFGGASALSTGHIDIVASNGDVVCSSLPSAAVRSYAGATWLRAALTTPTIAVPQIAARTANSVIVVASPVVGLGAVVAFVDLGRVGSALTATLGGARHLEFVVVDDEVVVSRSIGDRRWIGYPVAGTSLAPSVTASTRRDLDGTQRFYGVADVGSLRWKVFAGASAAQATAAADRLSNRQLVTTLASLLLIFGGALILYGRVVRPIHKLSDGVRAATDNPSPTPIRVHGPAEVVALAGDFNSLIDSAARGLASTSTLVALVESSADAIIGLTIDGTIVSWNAGARDMFGFAADEIVGQPAAALMVVDELDPPDLALGRSIDADVVRRFEARWTRHDHTVIDVSVTVSPILDRSGALLGRSATVRDVSERNRASTEALALNERLRQSERLESLGQLAGGIAHDFNNLIAVIMNYASFVIKHTSDRPAIQADVEQIQIASQRAARLTKQLLTFARSERIYVEALDISDIVAEITTMLARTIGPHIELTVERSAEPPIVSADHGQIEQILLNLVVNARDAMPDGGTLTIETKCTHLDEMYTRLHPGTVPGRYVELVVSDTGVGMTPEVAGHIFEPFFTTKAKGEGTGLGLATVYGIVTSSGGAMSVYSELGIGTTFRLYFPSADEPSVVATAAGQPAVAGDGEVILVVEDEPAVLELTCRILREDGYAVLAAATFEAALSMAATHDFGLLLTDSVMPHMSGRVLARRIDEIQPGRPVLFMSGYSMGFGGPGGLLDGSIAFIQKPFNRRTLIERVQEALAASALPVE